MKMRPTEMVVSHVLQRYWLPATWPLPRQPPRRRLQLPCAMTAVHSRHNALCTADFLLLSLHTDRASTHEISLLLRTVIVHACSADMSILLGSNLKVQMQRLLSVS